MKLNPLWRLLLLAALVPSLSPCPVSAAEQPNVIFILADDLGYGELGCYGQRQIQTPHLDRMAAEGMRFTQFYAGSTVCAPSRCVLMTGRHLGHCWVRGNAPAGKKEWQTLRKGEPTVARVFKQAGYATGLFGKWGLGELGTDGHPNRAGFDVFYGYLSQHHAHNYYPTYLFRNGEIVPLRNLADEETPGRGDGWAKVKVDYSHDLIMAEAMQWLEANRARPFFLYLALTIPHANNEAARAKGDGQEVPDYGPYADRDWPNPDKGQAAMITRMDRDLGNLRERLEAYGIARNTLILFTSDNGPHREGGNDPEFFDANGPLRGYKRALYEGGIRVPTLAVWPGTIAPGGVSDHVGYHGDLMATAHELTGGQLPEGYDSISLMPTLRGQPEKQGRHEYLYWEFYEQGSRQAVRFDRWKAIRQPMHTGPIQLFDLTSDLGEDKDVAAQHPEAAARAARLMDQAHVPNPNWKAPPARTPGNATAGRR